MPDLIHAIATDESPHGFSVTSPQLPGLVYGRPTQQELEADYQSALRYAGVSEGKVQGHFQRRGVTVGGHEYQVRWAQDEHIQARIEGVHRVLVALGNGADGDEMAAEQVADAAGVVTFVSCLASDTLGWLADQLDPRGDSLTAAVAVAEQFVYCVNIATGAVDAEGLPSLAELGWEYDMTFGELVQNHRGEQDGKRRASTTRVALTV